MTRAHRLCLFDLDSTLFNQHGFVIALPVAVANVFGESHGITAETFSAALKQYYVEAGYEIDRHLADHGIHLEDTAVWQGLIREVLAVHQQLTGDANLLFDDVAGSLNRLKADPKNTVAIMTVNPVLTFKFKSALCGNVLEGIYVRVVSSNKGLILADEWKDAIVFDGVGYESALVVDDHPAQIEAVPSRPEIERVQTVRPERRYPASTDPAIRVVTSLGEVR